MLRRQGPSGGVPWTTVCLQDSFPDCMGLKNRIFFDKVCKNLQVPPMGELRPQLGARNGKCGPNLTTNISKSKICDFPKLAPERSWGIAGMVGRAETCSKHRARAPRGSLPLTTAEVTNRNVYKSHQIFAPPPALDLQGISNGYVGGRQSAQIS